MSLMIRCHKENKNVELQPPAFGASIPFNQRRVSASVPLVLELKRAMNKKYKNLRIRLTVSKRWFIQVIVYLCHKRTLISLHND